MNNKNLTFSEKTQKIKAKSLTLSAISLFIGLTQSLPTQVSVIGLNLKDKEVVLAWFIFVITLMLFIHFLLLAYVEISNYYSSSLLRGQMENASGSQGTTSKEFAGIQAEAEYYEKQQEQHTSNIEFEEMRDNQIQIQNTFNRKNLNFYNGVTLLMEFFLPFTLAVIGLFYLLRYMACLM